MCRWWSSFFSIFSAVQVVVWTNRFKPVKASWVFRIVSSAVVDPKHLERRNWVDVPNHLQRRNGVDVPNHLQRRNGVDVPKQKS
jgi:hypothetical protein